MIKTITVQSLFQNEILKQLECSDIERVLRCYFRMQKTLVSNNCKAEIKAALENKVVSVFGYKPVEYIIIALTEKVKLAKN